MSCTLFLATLTVLLRNCYESRWLAPTVAVAIQDSEPSSKSPAASPIYITHQSSTYRMELSIDSQGNGLDDGPASTMVTLSDDKKACWTRRLPFVVHRGALSPRGQMVLAGHAYETAVGEYLIVQLWSSSEDRTYDFRVLRRSHHMLFADPPERYPEVIDVGYASNYSIACVLLAAQYLDKEDSMYELQAIDILSGVELRPGRQVHLPEGFQPWRLVHLSVPNVIGIECTVSANAMGVASECRAVAIVGVDGVLLDALMLTSIPAPSCASDSSLREYLECESPLRWAFVSVEGKPDAIEILHGATVLGRMTLSR